MKAIIMAGGEGTRLRPLTCTMPKPMAPLLDKPIVDYTMELLKKHGFDEAIFTLHYMGDAIKAHIGDGSAWNIKTRFSDPGKKIGTAGSVKHALGDISESVLILSGDGITDIDLTRVVSAHKASGADATIVLSRVDEPTEYGVVLLDREGFIERFIEKPERAEVFSDRANTGIYVLEPSALELIPKDKDFDFSKDLFPLMMERGMKLFGYEASEYWCDIGDLGEYRRAQRDMLEGRLEFIANETNSDGLFISKSAVIAQDAKLTAPCYIGENAIIGSGAQIGKYSVICGGAVVEEGASVKRSIVLKNAHIGKNAALRESIVCENALIGEDAALYSGSVVGAGGEIGRGVSLMTNVCVWPDKRIESGEKLRDNLIWGVSPSRAEFDNGCITGGNERSITPETALRLGAAFASRFSLPVKLAIGSDGNAQSAMLEYALTAGMISRGADVARSLPTSRSVFAFTVDSCYSGGIYVHCEDGLAKLELLSSHGEELTRGELRSVRSAFLLGEQEPYRGAELGIVESVNGMEDAYELRLINSIDKKTLEKKRGTLILSADGQTTRILAKTLLSLGWRVLGAAKRDALTPSNDDDTLSVHIGTNGMLSVSIGDTAADAQRILTVLCLSEYQKGGEKRIVLPASMHEEYRRILTEAGLELSFSKDRTEELIKTAREKGGAYAFMYEPELAVMRLCELVSRGELKKRIEELPVVFTREDELESSWKQAGRLLGKLIELENGSAERELVEGMRLKYDTGWVVVKPTGGSRAAFRVVAGSARSEYADELCNIYLEKLKQLKRETQDE